MGNAVRKEIPRAYPVARSASSAIRAGPGSTIKEAIKDSQGGLKSSPQEGLRQAQTAGGQGHTSNSQTGGHGGADSNNNNNNNNNNNDHHDTETAKDKWNPARCPEKGAPRLGVSGLGNDSGETGDTATDKWNPARTPDKHTAANAAAAAGTTMGAGSAMTGTAMGAGSGMGMGVGTASTMGGFTSNNNNNNSNSSNSNMEEQRDRAKNINGMDDKNRMMGSDKSMGGSGGMGMNKMSSGGSMGGVGLGMQGKAQANVRDNKPENMSHQDMLKHMHVRMSSEGGVQPGPYTKPAHTEAPYQQALGKLESDQIRRLFELHNKDPNEWNASKLAQKFNIGEHDMKNILKNFEPARKPN